MFALVDGKNFYVSVECLFRPSLIGKPVVVLSGNDGCVVSRSDEAKLLGIKMGQPFFQLREHVNRHGLVMCSSNFSLYADMSQRVATILRGTATRAVQYSTSHSCAGPVWIQTSTPTVAGFEPVYSRKRVFRWGWVSARPKRWQRQPASRRRSGRRQVVLWI